jgi:hypothetical protein
MINSSIIKSKFLRNKETQYFTFTKTWQAVDANIQQIVLSSIKMTNSETPVILYYLNEKNWWLMSNQALYLQNTSFQYIYFKDIDSVDIPTLWSGEVSKTEISSVNLQVGTREFEVKLEPKSWPIMFSILQFVKGKEE